jgi:hypothetical protein
VNSEEKRKILICTGLTRAAKEGKNLLHRHDEPNEPTKKGSLSYVLQESPFASVSTVSRGHLSLVSLSVTWRTAAFGLNSIVGKSLLLGYYFLKM